MCTQITPLPVNHSLYPYFIHLQSVLRVLKPRYLLLNGNVEKQLKAFFANFLDGRDCSSYVMDKKVQNHEVDLMIFDGSSVKYIETKCTFSRDKNATLRAVADAIIKGRKDLEIQTNENCKRSDSFVIHFLNGSNPCAGTSSVPDDIKERYCAIRNKDSMCSQALGQLYCEKLGNNHKDKILTFDILFVNEPGFQDCRLSALIIHLKGAASNLKCNTPLG